MHKIKPFIFPSLLFLLSFILRLLLISKGPFNIDCLGLAIISQKTLETYQLQYFFGFGYPLTVLLGSACILFLKLFSINDPIIALNFMSVLFSSLCIPVFYLITKKLFDSPTALFSSILFSVCPFFLGISVYGMSHAPSLFFLLIGIFFLLKYKENLKTKYFFLSSISIGLVGAARLQDLCLILIPVLFLFLQKNFSKKNVINLLWFGIIIFLTTTLFHIPFFLENSREAYLKQLDLYQKTSFASNISPQIFITNIKIIAATLSPIGLLMSILGLFYTYKKSPQTTLILILWIVIPLLLYSRLQTTAPRFFVIILPPLLMSTGFLLNKFMQLNKIFRFISLSVYLILILTTFGNIYPRLAFRHKYALLPNYVKWVEKNTEHNARIITGDDHGFFTYYTQRQILKRPLRSTHFTKKELQEVKLRFNHLLNNNIPIYITFIGLYDYDPNQEFSEFMKENYKLEIIGEALYEGWHSGSLTKRIFYNPLVKITHLTQPEI
ncbi:hypothetical protein MNBD_UNCLBAC01-1301 [hydrothermal vent metagenome]|uniref:Glycosyltransferase RgtA/B/C/D-like domain-containing protein n=1 Tax=hydrothermal vent metagenome TaxID=652676 RepID=A0A3B1E3J2_9ZZZZ